jgi:hypothetical protein
VRNRQAHDCQATPAFEHQNFLPQTSKGIQHIKAHIVGVRGGKKISLFLNTGMSQKCIILEQHLLVSTKTPKKKKVIQR